MTLVRGSVVEIKPKYIKPDVRRARPTGIPAKRRTNARMNGR